MRAEVSLRPHFIGLGKRGERLDHTNSYKPIRVLGEPTPALWPREDRLKAALRTEQDCPRRYVVGFRLPSAQPNVPDISCEPFRLLRYRRGCVRVGDRTSGCGQGEWRCFRGDTARR